MAFRNISTDSDWSKFKYDDIVKYVETHCVYVQDLPQINALNCTGGILWIFEGSGRMWLTTKIGNDWKQTTEFVKCLVKYVGTYQKFEWLNLCDGICWANNNANIFEKYQCNCSKHDHYNQQFNKIVNDNSQFLNSKSGDIWIKFNICNFELLDDQLKNKWITNCEYLISDLGSRTILEWFSNINGFKWMCSENGFKWMNSGNDFRWMNSENGSQWINSKNGLRWMNSKNGKQWMNSENGLRWMNSENGIKWTNSNKITVITHIMGCNVVNDKITSIVDSTITSEWFDTSHGYNWLTENVWKCLESRNNKNWSNSLKWFETYSGTNWLLNSVNGKKWLKTKPGYTFIIDCTEWIIKTNYMWYDYDFILFMLNKDDYLSSIDWKNAHNFKYENIKNNYRCIFYYHNHGWRDLWEKFLLSVHGFEFIISKQFTDFLINSNYMVLLSPIFTKFLFSDSGTKYLNSIHGKIFVKIVKTFITLPHYITWLCTEDGRYITENNLIEHLTNLNNVGGCV